MKLRHLQMKSFAGSQMAEQLSTKKCFSISLQCIVDNGHNKGRSFLLSLESMSSAQTGFSIKIPQSET